MSTVEHADSSRAHVVTCFAAGCFAGLTAALLVGVYWISRDGIPRGKAEPEWLYVFTAAISVLATLCFAIALRIATPHGLSVARWPAGTVAAGLGVFAPTLAVAFAMLLRLLGHGSLGFIALPLVLVLSGLAALPVAGLRRPSRPGPSTSASSGKRSD